jgi:hypothetical protein
MAFRKKSLDATICVTIQKIKVNPSVDLESWSSTKEAY